MITALLTALSETLRPRVWASLTHKATWQDAGITLGTSDGSGSKITDSFSVSFYTSPIIA